MKHGMEFTVKIHSSWVYLIAEDITGAFIFNKNCSFHIWPWTNIEKKIRGIEALWRRHHAIIFGECK